MIQLGGIEFPLDSLEVVEVGGVSLVLPRQASVLSAQTRHVERPKSLLELAVELVPPWKEAPCGGES